MSEAQSISEPPLKERLSTTTSVVYIVEMLVGNTWVRQDNTPHQNYSSAELAAARAAQEATVKEVRVCSVAVVTTVTKLLGLQPAPAIVKTKPGFRPTGCTVECRLCKTQQPTMLDSTNSTFVFCGRCNRAYPC